MLTDRFVKFIKVEWDDFFGLNGEDKNKQKKDEKTIFEQMFGSFSKEDKQTATNAEKEKAYQEYQKYYKQQQQQQNSYSQQQQDFAKQEAKHYDALEIKKGASFDEIKSAYKQAMKKYHPDRFAGDAEKQKYAQILSQKINEAYQYFEKKFGK